MPSSVIRPTTHVDSTPACNSPTQAYDGGTGAAPDTSTYAYHLSPGAGGYATSIFKVKNCGSLPGGCIAAYMKARVWPVPATNAWVYYYWYTDGGTTPFNTDELYVSDPGGPVVLSHAISTSVTMSNLVWESRPNDPSGAGLQGYSFVWDCWVEAWTAISAPGSPSCTPGLRKNSLGWSAVSGADDYVIRWTSDGSTPTKSSAAITPGNVTSYEHTSLSHILYKYKISARDAGDAAGGDLSTEVSGTPALPGSAISSIIGF